MRGPASGSGGSRTKRLTTIGERGHLAHAALSLRGPARGAALAVSILGVHRGPVENLSSKSRLVERVVDDADHRQRGVTAGARRPCRRRWSGSGPAAARARQGDPRDLRRRDRGPARGAAGSRSSRAPGTSSTSSWSGDRARCLATGRSPCCARLRVPGACCGSSTIVPSLKRRRRGDGPGGAAGHGAR